MMHSISEIYTLYNCENKIRYATAEYVEANKIFVPDDFRVRQRMIAAGIRCARTTNSHMNNNKPVKILDANGIKEIYLFGEKTWFDTAEELAAHREEYQRECAEQKAKNKVKKEIASILDGMELQDLEILLAKLS